MHDVSLTERVAPPEGLSEVSPAPRHFEPRPISARMRSSEQKCIGIAFHGLLSEFQDVDIVGDLDAGAHVLIHEDDSNALARQSGDVIVDLGGIFRSDHCRRLVEEQRLGLEQQRPRDLQ